jgi:hypothetical protein
MVGKFEVETPQLQQQMLQLVGHVSSIQVVLLSLQVIPMLEQTCILPKLAAARRSLLTRPTLPPFFQQAVTGMLQIIQFKHFDCGGSTQGRWGRMPRTTLGLVTLHLRLLRLVLLLLLLLLLLLCNGWLWLLSQHNHRLMQVDTKLWTYARHQPSPHVCTTFQALNKCSTCKVLLATFRKFVPIATHTSEAIHENRQAACLSQHHPGGGAFA